MAKAASASYPSDHDDWKVDDAMHTMMRAGEIVKDKKLMEKVRTRAKDHAAKMRDVAERAGALAKRGLISDKAMAKMNGKGGKSGHANQGGSMAALDKTRPIA